VIGTFGSSNFEVSGKRIFTPFDEEMSAGNKAETKDASGAKAQTVKTTPELRTYKFKVSLSKSLGVDVQATIDKWMKLAEAGTAEYLNMGGKPMASNKFLLKSVSFTEVNRNGKGLVLSATMALEFQEYVKAVAVKKPTKKKPKKKPKIKPKTSFIPKGATL
jgi:hypothetical protein